MLFLERDTDRLTGLQIAFVRTRELTHHNIVTSLDPRGSLPPPLKEGLPSREAKKLRGQHDLDFAEEATRACGV